MGVGRSHSCIIYGLLDGLRTNSHLSVKATNDPQNSLRGVGLGEAGPGVEKGPQSKPHCDTTKNLDVSTCGTVLFKPSISNHGFYADNLHCQCGPGQQSSVRLQFIAFHKNLNY